MKVPKPSVKKVIQGGITVFIFTLLASPFGYLIRLIYSRTLSIEMYGLFFTILLLFNFINIFSDLGFGYSIIYFVPKYKKEKKFKKVWNLYVYGQIIEIITSITIAISLFFLSDYLANNYFRVEIAKNILLIFSVYLISGTFASGIMKFFTGLQTEKYYAPHQFIKTGLALLFSIGVWISGNTSINNYAIAWAASNLVTSILYLYILKKALRGVDKTLSWDSIQLKKMYSYAYPSLLATALISLTYYLDTFMLTYFRGIREAGIIQVVIPIVSVSSLVISPVNRLILPLVSQLVDLDKKKVVTIITFILKIIPFITFYFSFFIFLYPGILTRVLFGEKWLGLVEQPLMIFSIGYIGAVLTTYLINVVGGIGEVRKRLKATFFIISSNVVLGVILISQFGVLGAVITNFAVNTISVILLIRIIKEQIDFRIPYTFYIKICSIAILILLFRNIFNLYPKNLFELIVTGSIYSIIFLIVGYKLKVIDSNTKKITFDVVKDKINLFRWN
jgi:O-antigen/teichoic acid export membrane protein